MMILRDLVCRAGGDWWGHCRLVLNPGQISTHSTSISKVLPRDPSRRDQGREDPLAREIRVIAAVAVMTHCHLDQGREDAPVLAREASALAVAEREAPGRSRGREGGGEGVREGGQVDGRSVEDIAALNWYVAVASRLSRISEITAGERVDGRRAKGRRTKGLSTERRNQTVFRV